MAKYIGEDMVYGDPVTGQSITLQNGTEYNVQFQHDGPITIINGQQIMDPNATVWAIIDDGRISIPFAPDLIKNFFEVETRW